MPAERRPYLRSDERRRSLLEAARRRFAREGLAGLTVVAVAAEAGVSRRLVYEHFSDLADLYRAFFTGRLTLYQASIEQALAEQHADLAAAVIGVFDRLTQIPAEDQRALRVLAADAGPTELAAISELFRTRTTERWLPLLNVEALGVDGARALIWALATALFSLADLVSRGEVGQDRAAGLIRALLAAAAGATAAGAAQST